MRVRRFRRFVAVGDSLTEGLGDRLPDGSHRGWADRLAERLAAAHPGVTYANLAVRGLGTGSVRATQLDPALALRPDLVAAFLGVNDLAKPRTDLAAFAGHLDAFYRAFSAAGATVVAATPPDLSRQLPLARLVRRRAAALREVVLDRAAAYGVLVVDLWTDPATGDPALWGPDRVHPSPHGHALLADRAGALLGLPAPAPGAAPAPAPVPGARSRLGPADASWFARELTPFLWRRLRGRPPGLHCTAKRPDLLPVEPGLPPPLAEGA